MSVFELERLYIRKTIGKYCGFTLVELLLFLSELPKKIPLLDPWGSPYQYLKLLLKSKGKVCKDHNLVPSNSDYDLYSLGKDKQSVSPLTAKASNDDIIRANNGDFVGLALGY